MTQAGRLLCHQLTGDGGSWGQRSKGLWVPWEGCSRVSHPQDLTLTERQRQRPRDPLIENEGQRGWAPVPSRQLSEARHQLRRSCLLAISFPRCRPQGQGGEAESSLQLISTFQSKRNSPGG